MKKLLSDNSKQLINYLLSNETISNKVKAAGEENEHYAIFSIKDSGIIVLGKTKYPFWNRLIKCQFPLTFQAFVSAVWDALLDLSVGGNKEALLKGLSKEIMEKCQREQEYDWIVERLVDCYRHVANNKGGADSAESPGKSGRSVAHVCDDDESVIVNVNVGENTRKRVIFPDATGTANIEFEMGITGVNVRKR